MHCPACGQANPEGTKFCFACGARQQSACETCGAALPPDARFCGECGAPASAATPPPIDTFPTHPPLPASFVGGRYAVRSFLGEGGKKQVYLAHDTLLERDVAFSLIKTDGLDEVGVERIRREARVMGRLGGHPHIVSLFDMGDEAGRTYLVSELMAGGDVEGLIAAAPEHRLPLPETLRIAEQVCRALAYAHEHGVIHRDLKPGNVWLTRDGVAKLGDFGLAMAIDRTRLSVAGMIVGTVAYMPPEQAMGRVPDARSDLYSLGAMLYELTTGRPPFLGDDPVAIIGQHLNTAPVAPTWHNPTLSRPLETLVLALLAKDPNDRPASATAVRSQLAAISAAEALRTTPGSSEVALLEPANPLDRLASGVFVGREAEAAALRAALDAALSGCSQTALLVGEPGIGKTRLAEELGTYAGMRGAQVLWGRCYEWEGTPAYWPWVQIIRSYVHARDPQGLRSELGSGAGDIAQVVSEIRERLPGIPDPPVTEPEQARFRLFDSIATFLRNASTHQPLVLVLDDLHWADKPSLLLLEFLTRELRDARMLLLGTYRDVEVGRHHPLSQTLAELSRGRASRRVALRGLTRDEVGAFIAMSAGMSPPNALVAAVHQETEGNPFFMAEVVRLLVAEGRLERPEATRSWSVSLPESVREVVGKRLDRLSEECNRVLSVASVIGREFRLATLERVTGTPADELLDLLEEALQSRLIQDWEGVGHYRFSHALVQETLYAELSAARKARLHGQVGDAIERLQAANLPTYYGELAQHYFEAAAAGNADKAIDYSVKAAERALAQFAWEPAIDHYERALQAIELIVEPDPVLLCEILLALGHAQDLVLVPSYLTKPLEVFLRAAEIARRAGLNEHLARAALGYGFHDHTYAAGGFEQLQLSEEGLAALGPGDSSIRARLLIRLAADVRWMLPGEFERSKSLCDEALAMARRLHDPPTLLGVLACRQSILPNIDTLEQCISETAEMLRMPESEHSREHLAAVTYGYNALFHCQLGDIREADRLIETLGTIVRQSRTTPIGSWVELALRTERWRMTGRFVDANRLLEEMIAIAPHNTWWSFPQLVVQRREQARLYDITQEVRQDYQREIIDNELVQHNVGLHQFARTLLAWLDLERGNVDAARATLNELSSEQIVAILRGYFDWPGTMALVSEMCAKLGDTQRAAHFYNQLLPYGARNLCSGITLLLFGAGHHYLGLLATTLSRWDDAAQHFEHAHGDVASSRQHALRLRRHAGAARRTRRPGAGVDAAR